MQFSFWPSRAVSELMCLMLLSVDSAKTTAKEGKMQRKVDAKSVREFLGCDSSLLLHPIFNEFFGHRYVSPPWLSGCFAGFCLFVFKLFPD